jgi:hypothetical protein
LDDLFLGFVCACRVCLAVIVLIRSYMTAARNSHAGARVRQSGRQSWFFIIAAAAALWFLGSSMYFRFHALGVDSEQIELRFFWPRPPVVIPVSELAEVEFSPAYRSCGHIELSTQTERYLSVNFTDCKMFATLRDEFTAKAGAQWR